MNYLELFGYLASSVVAVSLMMKNIRRLRWYNLIGAVMFSVYGYFINAWPVTVLNGFIALADVYYLVLMYKKVEYFEVLELKALYYNNYLQRFFSHFQDDIHIWFPDFQLKDCENRKGYFILRDMLPVSLVVMEKDDNNDFHVILDYAVPAYRDLKNARFFYHKHLNQKDFPAESRLIVENSVKENHHYWLSVGFEKESENRFVKMI